MQRRVFSSLIVAAVVLFFGTLSFSQTEEMLNNELGAAEDAAGGKKPKELKSDGTTLDAVGIPSETDNTIPDKPVVKTVPPPPPAPPPPAPTQPKEVTKEKEPPPPAIEDAPPPAETTEAPPTEDAPQVAEPEAPPATPTEEPKEDTVEHGGRTSVSTFDGNGAPEIKNKICNCRFRADVPYRERRPTVTWFFGAEGGTYQPTNYTPAITSNQNFSNYYGGGASPNIEVVFGPKLNFFAGSLGLQVGGGYFGASATDGSSMTVYPLTAGLVFALDTIFKEPYVVPYAVGGMYTDFYKEQSQGLSVNGRTSFAGFYAFGLMFQLDWMDPDSHESGYEDFGLQNTFLFVEARSFLPSNDYPTDLSTPLQVSGGIRFEY